MVNSSINTRANVTTKGEKLEELTSFKYLRSTLSKAGTRTVQVRIRIVMANAVMVRLSRLWTSKYILFRM
ncbi:hypothetical protein DPMN_062317 [Dreissena polymorpha]|uniref:Uncharacterized protein n=1 Tax=Dreissena polymorpha TaxID=45954 RepID=A0A9D4HHP2_DREPO|nr:hypothetical protein DPMN_062317 [Dreissena polymorpha]